MNTLKTVARVYVAGVVPVFGFSFLVSVVERHDRNALQFSMYLAATWPAQFFLFRFP